ncbi:hypothetical protein COV93_06185 [Candidatus Woesearchaeota archaeon CG11_big_fil_rev_8_21_14_0_20_43_8]|nr:MAG: hypothetical protein COV93_06185 [Candidatus Woesearchaeota archaeon CG11_big_fil_rev_8_21_14_0_20_43_8]PIO05410.1 MAG: hypothetical protein COT47_04955 [Candidatus Woesearchaeota archaeon CG08_land_8_20_14_0_20_43_7]
MWLADILTKNPMLLMVLAVCAFMMIAVVIVLRTRPLIPFLYAGARVSARSAYLIGEQQYTALTSAGSFAELKGALERTNYSELFRTIAEDPDLMSLHSELEKGFVKELEEVKGFSGVGLSHVLDTFVMMWEAKLIKTFAKARMNGREPDEQFIFPVGCITERMIERLNGTKTVQDMGAVLASTRFAPAFDRVSADIWEFEITVDSFILENFKRLSADAKVYDGRFMSDMLAARFDMINIITILKKTISGEDLSLIPTGTDVEKLLREFKADGEEREKRLANSLKSTLYGEAMQKGYESFLDDGHYSHFENALHRAYMGLVKKNELMHYQGPFPIYAYLLRKEYEMRNLMVLSKGIQDRYTPEEKTEMMII